ncbi:hypothetical protein [Sphingomonas sp. 1185]|uniref:hypothetical protein n=1 Tax=Sphingomonas sp. 1185 TaxID=3156411 RepID=UPI00339205D2
MRLADTLARRRLRYARPLPTMPDICLIDVPPPYASPSLALGRYYPVILETDLEWDEWDRFLTVDRHTPVAPDLFDRRPSALHADTIILAHYDPPEPGWPWILLCRWPIDHVALAGDASDLFARSAYSVEILPDPTERATMQDRVLHSLGRQRAVNLTLVPGGAIAGNG